MISAILRSRKKKKGTGVLQLELTDRALEAIQRIQAADPDTRRAVLRIQIIGSGPDGPQYKLGFDNQPPLKDDKSHERKGITVVADSRTALFLGGSTLDFVEGVAGRGFIFKAPDRNPQRPRS